MSTRSTISIQSPEGDIRTVYCHYDGYLSHNGALLYTHYNTEEKVNALIDLGDLSSLREKLIPDPDSSHTWETPQEDVTVAYHRDRGEELHIDRSASIHSIDSQDYNYIFKDGAWHYWTWDKVSNIQPLTF
jgi:hypothetical protein